jgi:hypothetical protein
MPLWDTLLAAGAKYGPSIIKAAGQYAGAGVQPSGSPMYPGGPMGFAAPARGGGFASSGGPRKKHRRGLTASDIRGAQKVARVVQHFGYKPKIKARRRGRR